MNISGITNKYQGNLINDSQIKANNISFASKADFFQKQNAPEEKVETSLANKLLTALKKVLYPVAFAIHKISMFVSNTTDKIKGTVNKIRKYIEKRHIISDLIDNVKSHKIHDGIFSVLKAGEPPSNDITNYKFKLEDKVINISKIISHPSKDKKFVSNKLTVIYPDDTTKEKNKFIDLSDKEFIKLEKVFQNNIDQFKEISHSDYIKDHLL
ncbi:MAG: hypothetical protein AB1782_08020 [Cyanobacteriota bacterium]